MMETKALISVIVLAISLAQIVPGRIGDREAQEVQEQQEEQEAQEAQLTPIMPEPEFGKIMSYLDDQVPEIEDEWAGYIRDQSRGEAHLTEWMGDHEPVDVYRDYEETEYLGKYYTVYVGESWEDHSVNWAYFYVKRDFSEVLWDNYLGGIDSEYPVLYLDEWRNSEYYRKLDKCSNKIWNEEGDCELVLYDKEDREVFSASYPSEPWVKKLKDDIWEISVSTGSPSRYVFYFDRERGKISDTFFNPILFEDHYVAYMEDNVLILTDIFGESVLYREIERNFSEMADPISAVKKIEISWAGDIILQYYEGEGMELIEERIEKEHCSMEDLGEMDYYLFCHTEMSTDVGPVEFASVVINNETQTVREAMELYQKFKEKLPLEEEDRENAASEDEKTEIVRVSPDCKWIVTQKWSDHQRINTQMLFHEKEKVREKVSESGQGDRPILIVKDEGGYKALEEEQYNKLLGIRKEIGYLGANKLNAEGELYAGVNVEYSLLTIAAMRDEAELWSYDLATIRKNTREIRKRWGYVEDSVLGVSIEQFEGNEQEGWLVVRIGPSSFYKIAYPSGDDTYLGEYLYSPSFSPDGKYMAYSGIDYSNVVGMELDEQEQLPPQGIYVKEIATAKTAYMDWDELPENRSFIWLDKASFEEYMADTGGRE